MTTGPIDAYWPPRDKDTPHAAVIVAAYEVVRVFPRPTYQEAEEAVKQWYLEAKDQVYKEESRHKYPGPDPDTATFEDIQAWYTADGSTYDFMEIYPTD